MNFGIGSTFSKGQESAISEGPGSSPGPGPFYKVCRVVVCSKAPINYSNGIQTQRLPCNYVTSLTVGNLE